MAWREPPQVGTCVERVVRMLGIRKPEDLGLSGKQEEAWAVAEMLLERGSAGGKSARTVTLRQSGMREGDLVFLCAAVPYFEAALRVDPVLSDGEPALGLSLPKATVDIARCHLQACREEIKRKSLSSESRPDASQEANWVLEEAHPVCPACYGDVGEGSRVDNGGRTWHRSCFALGHRCAHCGETLCKTMGSFVPGGTGSRVYHPVCASAVFGGQEQFVCQGKGDATIRCTVRLAGRQILRGSAVVAFFTIDRELRAPRAIAVSLRLVRKERRCEGNRIRLKDTVACCGVSRLSGLLPMSHRLLRASGSVALTVPSGSAPSHLYDRAFSREYTLIASVHLSGLFRKPVSMSFTVTVID